jgi:hypothetical protein
LSLIWVVELSSWNLCLHQSKPQKHNWGLAIMQSLFYYFSDWLVIGIGIELIFVISVDNMNW